MTLEAKSKEAPLLRDPYILCKKIKGKKVGKSYEYAQIKHIVEKEKNKDNHLKTYLPNYALKQMMGEVLKLHNILQQLKKDLADLETRNKTEIAARHTSSSAVEISLDKTAATLFEKMPPARAQHQKLLWQSLMTSQADAVPAAADAEILQKAEEMAESCKKISAQIERILEINCPFSTEQLINPYFCTADAQTYDYDVEERNILEVLQEQKKSPVTRDPITQETRVIPNINLKQAMDFWRTQQSILPAQYKTKIDERIAAITQSIHQLAALEPIVHKKHARLQTLLPPADRKALPSIQPVAQAATSCTATPTGPSPYRSAPITPGASPYADPPRSSRIEPAAWQSALDAADSSALQQQLKHLDAESDPTKKAQILKELQQLRIDGFTLAEYMALYSPWPISTKYGGKKEILKQLKAIGITLSGLLQAAMAGNEKEISTLKNKQQAYDSNNCHWLYYAALNGHLSCVKKFRAHCPEDERIAIIQLTESIQNQQTKQQKKAQVEPEPTAPLEHKEIPAKTFDPPASTQQTNHISAMKMQIIKKRLEIGGDVNLMLDEESLLCIAIQMADHTLVSKLLEAKAKVDTIGIDGRTALHIAAYLGQLDNVNLLLKANAKMEIETPQSRATALHVAIMQSHLPVVKALLEARANIGAKRKDGMTPLHIACSKNDLAIVNILLQEKADVNARAANGLPPIRWAYASANADMARMLLEAKAEMGPFPDDTLGKHTKSNLEPAQQSIGTITSPGHGTPAATGGQIQKKITLLKNLLSDMCHNLYEDQRSNNLNAAKIFSYFKNLEALSKQVSELLTQQPTSEQRENIANMLLSIEQNLEYLSQIDHAAREIPDPEPGSTIDNARLPDRRPREASTSPFSAPRLTHFSPRAADSKKSSAEIQKKMESIRELFKQAKTMVPDLFKKDPELYKIDQNTSQIGFIPTIVLGLYKEIDDFLRANMEVLSAEEREECDNMLAAVTLARQFFVKMDSTPRASKPL